MEKARKILCIDDDLMTLDLLKACLCPEEGFEVEIAANAVDGLEMARNHKPDAILLDWLMPGACGLDALRLIRGEPSLHLLPVFMVTGRTAMSDIECAANCDATGYFTKPLNPILVANRLHRVLDQTPKPIRVSTN